jgi:immune inhibitor A
MSLRKFLLSLALIWLSSTPVAAQESINAGSPSRAMAERLHAAPLPTRDPIALAVRLRGVPTDVAYATPDAAAPLALGREDTFWILDQRSAHLFQARATLRLVTDHAYWYVETALADRAPQAELERSANAFETRIYPTILQYFGSVPSPGVDGDPRIVLLLGNVPGVAAYFSSADAYSSDVSPRSNQREMIYLNLNGVRPGQQGFDSTVTHELQHMAHFGHCPGQESWVDEGASELASRVAGYNGGAPQAFLARPDIQLNAWSSQPADLTRHYQAAYLFVRYVAERGGGWGVLPQLFANCARGEDLFSAFLQQQPLAADFESLFADWTVANLLQDAAVADGRYVYADAAFRLNSVTGRSAPGEPFSNTIPQFAANYVDLPSGDGSVTFSGDSSVTLLDAAADGAPLWWSNRGDSLDARLTRRIDLSNASEATLRFRGWYDLEPDFDFVYLSASTDGGQTWAVLPGRHTVADSATGNNYGVGWTGASGAWVDEEVDLTPFVGTDLLVRFEYLTDQSFNAQGFAMRDFEVPQLEIAEPGVLESAWSAEGWVRVDAPVPERWNLRLVRWTPDGVFVDPIGVTLDGSAVFNLDPTATRSTLVISPTAPRTLLPAKFSIAVD